MTPLRRAPSRRSLGHWDLNVHDPEVARWGEYGVDTLRAVTAVSGFFAEWGARRSLARLMDQVGAAGLAAAAAVPAVSAVVDQHAAAVRDILVMGVEGSASIAGVVLLAGYATGLLDQAGTDAATVGAAVGDQWWRAEWLALRLVAICALSRSDGWTDEPPTGLVPEFGGTA